MLWFQLNCYPSFLSIFNGDNCFVSCCNCVLVVCSLRALTVRLPGDGLFVHNQANVRKCAADPNQYHCTASGNSSHFNCCHSSGYCDLNKQQRRIGRNCGSVLIQLFLLFLQTLTTLATKNELATTVVCCQIVVAVFVHLVSGRHM